MNSRVMRGLPHPVSQYVVLSSVFPMLTPVPMSLAACQASRSGAGSAARAAETAARARAAAMNRIRREERSVSTSKCRLRRVIRRGLAPLQQPGQQPREGSAAKKNDQPQPPARQAELAMHRGPRRGEHPRGHDAHEHRDGRAPLPPGARDTREKGDEHGEADGRKQQRPLRAGQSREQIRQAPQVADAHAEEDRRGQQRQAVGPAGIHGALYAMHSTSTCAPSASPLVPSAERAGKCPEKNVLYTSLKSPHFAMWASITVQFTTSL